MRTWLEIDLKAISHNVKTVKKELNSNTKLMAVVKADGYGHGACEVSKTALKAGADVLAVATLYEAMELRNSGIDTEILILGPSFDDDIDNLIKYNITPTVIGYDFAKKLSKKSNNMKKIIPVHIKIDTGMSRIGYIYDDDKLIDEIKKINELNGIEIEGIFSHLSKADEDNKDFTNLQFERFKEVCDRLKESGINIPIKHICNSAGILRFKDYHLDMVRLGISLYGYYPSDVFCDNEFELKPAMTFKTQISNIKTVKKGTPIGYGGTYITDSGIKVATIPVGYADGYSRLLSNKGIVSVNGTRCRVLGNVCMDQTMIDVTNVNNINLGDEVILFGKSGDNNITVEEVASLIGTINYEVLCDISKRVPRIYIM